MGRRRPRPKKRPPTPFESGNEAGAEEQEAPMFPVGAEVEVCSDDPGFAGAFYQATVAGHLISSGSGGGRRYALAYSTLVAEEGGPHKETAAAADVRPRPPPEENAGAARRGFAIHDMVEAFHNDGWWAGVVSAVPPPPVTGDGLPRGVYEVTFPTSRETIEFEEAALRPHRVFEGGRWVPAAEVDNGSTLFSEGNEVEVSQSAKNLDESWSPATVLKVIGAKYFLVQYIHGEKDGELATEIVHCQYIRPARIIAHMDSRYRFSPSSPVEVFHQGSWWPGVIVEVLCSGIDKKYLVKLKNHGTYMEDMDCAGVLTVDSTQLRPRFDWDGKRWVGCKKEKPAKGPRLTARKRSISAALALYDGGDEFKFGSYRDKKLKKADVASKSISPLFSVRNDKYEISHMSCPYSEETMEQKNAVFALGSPLSLRSLPPMTAHGRLSSYLLAPSCHIEQSSQMIIIPQGTFLGTHSDLSKTVLTDQEKLSTVGSRTDVSRQKEECVYFQTPDALGESAETAKKGIASNTIDEDDDITAIFENLAELPNDMTAGCEILSEMNRASCMDLTPLKYIRGSQERSRVNDLQQGGYAVETSVEQDTGEDLCKRYLVMADDANDRLYIDNTTATVECMPACVTPAEDLPIISPATIDGGVPNLLQSDLKLEVDITDDMVEENPQGGSDSIQSIEKSTVASLSSVGMGNPMETVRLAMIKYVQGTPISKYISSRTQDPGCSLSPESIDVNESTVDMNGPPSESLAIQHLPFVKTSPIWAKLEALEIFSRVPQRPNFNLVRQHGPELREGLAIGLMVSFTFLAESINRLEVQDDNGPLEQKMLDLSLLEDNGFDVRDLRSRLETLLDARNSRIKPQDAMKKLEQKIAHKEAEDRELGVQIRKLAVAIHHVEVHAYLMRNVMRSAISQKMKNAMKISSLKTEAEELERYVSTATSR